MITTAAGAEPDTIMGIPFVIMGMWPIDGHIPHDHDG